jgi:hypothetical protein
VFFSGRRSSYLSRAGLPGARRLLGLGGPAGVRRGGHRTTTSLSMAPRCDTHFCDAAALSGRLAGGRRSRHRCLPAVLLLDRAGAKTDRCGTAPDTSPHGLLWRCFQRWSSPRGRNPGDPPNGVTGSFVPCGDRLRLD